MGHEPARLKGQRYVAEGRLIVVKVNGDRVRATCHGDGAVYQLGSDGPEDWCNCPARSKCAHLYALHLVTAPRGTS